MSWFYVIILDLLSSTGLGWLFSIMYGKLTVSVNLVVSISEIDSNISRNFLELDMYGRTFLP